MSLSDHYRAAILTDLMRCCVCGLQLFHRSLLRLFWIHLKDSKRYELFNHSVLLEQNKMSENAHESDEMVILTVLKPHCFHSV